MLQRWSEFRSNFLMDSKAFDSIIWNNCNNYKDGRQTDLLSYLYECWGNFYQQFNVFSQQC